MQPAVSSQSLTYAMSDQVTSESQRAESTRTPKSMTRPKVWSEEVEEAYRFQLAGYRDATDYKEVRKTEAGHDLFERMLGYS